ncbi:MAG: hypothetical protein WC697_00705 [Patescibacteria group bacterium]|jgi:hypothetical protein
MSYEQGENTRGIEQKEKEPNISYHFFYSYHDTAKDIENLGNAFKEADIYVPEAIMHTDEVRGCFVLLSRGLITSEEVAEGMDIKKNDSRFREFEIIYNSQKPILFADCPATDTGLVQKLQEWTKALGKGEQNFVEGRLSQAIEEIRSFINIFVEFQEEREKIIKINLNNQLKFFLEKHKEYTNKEKLRVLIKLGAYHTNLYHKFKEEDLSVSREFNQIPITYSIWNEAERMTQFNKDVSDEILAKGLIDIFLMAYLRDSSNDSEKIIRVNRKLLQSLKLKDIEQISKDYSKNQVINISEELKKFNITVPKSEEEMDKILGTKEE